jgi:hypothetical protein
MVHEVLPGEISRDSRADSGTSDSVSHLDIPAPAIALNDDSKPSGEKQSDSKNDGDATRAVASENADDLKSVLLGVEARLTEVFERKLAFDGFKEKQIDRLHEELQSYKGDLLRKATRPLLSALIKLHGDVIRLGNGVRGEGGLSRGEFF